MCCAADLIGINILATDIVYSEIPYSADVGDRSCLGAAYP
jgi:hypothetical protein